MIQLAQNIYFVILYVRVLGFDVILCLTFELLAIFFVQSLTNRRLGLYWALSRWKVTELYTVYTTKAETDCVQIKNFCSINNSIIAAI